MIDLNVIEFKKLALIRNAETALRRTGGQVLSLWGKSTLVNHRVGLVAALIDGTVFLRIGDSPRLPDFELTLEETKQLEEALCHARIAAQERIRQISGRAGWRVVARDGDRVEMVYVPWGVDREERRWFRKSRVGTSRRPTQCRNCYQTINRGDVVYRPEAKAGWGDAYFQVRLCERCASGPEQGLRLVKSEEAT